MEDRLTPPHGQKKCFLQNLRIHELEIYLISQQRFIWHGLDNVTILGLSHYSPIMECWPWLGEGGGGGYMATKLLWGYNGKDPLFFPLSFHPLVFVLI